MSDIEHIVLPVIPVANDQYESFGGKRWKIVGHFSSAAAQTPASMKAAASDKKRTANDRHGLRLVPPRK